MTAENGEPKTTVLDVVNDRLGKNNTEENKATIQSMAKKFRIQEDELTKWVQEDEQFQKDLERFGEYADKPLDNRLDTTLIALLLLETKRRHGK